MDISARLSNISSSCRQGQNELVSFQAGVQEAKRVTARVPDDNEHKICINEISENTNFIKAFYSILQTFAEVLVQLIKKPQAGEELEELGKNFLEPFDTIVKQFADFEFQGLSLDYLHDVFVDRQNPMTCRYEDQLLGAAECLDEAFANNFAKRIEARVKKLLGDFGELWQGLSQSLPQKISKKAADEARKVLGMAFVLVNKIEMRLAKRDQELIERNIQAAKGLKHNEDDCSWFNLNSSSVALEERPMNENPQIRDAARNGEKDRKRASSRYTQAWQTDWTLGTDLLDPAKVGWQIGEKFNSLLKTGFRVDPLQIWHSCFAKKAA